MPPEKKLEIKTALAAFTAGQLTENALNLFEILGYNTERRNPLDESTFACFKRNFIENSEKFRNDKALTDNWDCVDLLFQVTKSEIVKSLQGGSAQQEMDFGTEGNIGINKAIIESYLFFAIGLNSERYTRTELSAITREVNHLFPMPVMILFKHGSTLTLSVINRRINKKDGDKDVLEKVTLIKDIRIENPHRAHLDILFDLSFEELYRHHKFTGFVDLQKAWQKTLDTKELNKQFYQKLFNWYLFALQMVVFPQIRPETDMVNDKLHQSESLIRLLTRMLFVWFMKEKGLIKSDLFDAKKLTAILRNFTGVGSDETIYYKAILQNLFFATLNKPIDQRKVIDKGFNPREYGDPLVYRFDELFADPGNLLTYFENIPFLNGGLFDCLDQKKDADNPAEIRLDGFSTKKHKQVVFPDKLFFGEYTGIDLSRDYDDKKKNRVTVFGLIDILQQYKFTIEENTPVEEEVALDPELLGKVFENLLASYNPETQSTARKQTGSFYTPREIVNYMVDESLIAYLKNHLDDEPRLRQLFSYETAETANPFSETETVTLLKAIDGCKILDPACGSGAFPMGALQKMIHVLHRLDPENIRWFDMVVGNFPSYMQAEVKKRLEKENWNYVRKLGIIQQCLYGVDIQPIATQIAKLRFFISLLVDQTEKPGEPNRGFEPLPNLDFKIVTANTLIAAPKNAAIDAFAKPSVAQFEKATNDYFAASAENKGKLKLQIKKAIDEIVNANKMIINQWIEKVRKNSNSATGTKLKKMREQQAQFQRDLARWNTFPNLFKYESVAFFEPKYFFPQVKEGFDLVIGNPPYVNISNLKPDDYRLQLRSSFRTAKNKTDTYAFFIEKGFTLLQSAGILSYIIPQTWKATESFSVLREIIFREKSLLKIVDLNFGTFSAIVKPMVVVISNAYGKNKSISVLNDSFEIIESISIDEILNEPTLSINTTSNSIQKQLFEKIETDTVKLETIIQFSRGIKTSDDGRFIHHEAINSEFKRYSGGKTLKVIN